MKKENKKGDARMKMFFQLAEVVKEYRCALIREVEVIRQALVIALSTVRAGNVLTCQVAGFEVGSEAFLLLLNETLSGELSEVLGRSDLRVFFSAPEEWLSRGMKDIAILQRYLKPILGKQCPVMPGELTKIRVVEKVEIEESK